MLAKYRAAATAAAIMLALAVTFSFGSVRSAASDLLTIFRVEKVRTINLTPSDLSQIERAFREGAGKVDIENFKLESAGNESEKFLASPRMVDFDHAAGCPARRLLPEVHTARVIWNLPTPARPIRFCSPWKREVIAGRTERQDLAVEARSRSSAAIPVPATRVYTSGRAGVLADRPARTSMPSVTRSWPCPSCPKTCAPSWRQSMTGSIPF